MASNAGKENRALTAQLHVPRDPGVERVILLLRERFGVPAIRCVQWHGPERYQITFASNHHLLRALEVGLPFNGVSLQFHPLETPFVFITIKNAPFEMSRERLAIALSQYGDIMSHEFEFPAFMAPWSNGCRRLKFNMKKPVPNFLRVGPYNIMASYSGVVSLCRKCLSPDHIASGCDIKCVRCKTDDHEARACPRQKRFGQLPPDQYPAADIQPTAGLSTPPDLQPAVSAGEASAGPVSYAQATAGPQPSPPPRVTTDVIPEVTPAVIPVVAPVSPRATADVEPPVEDNIDLLDFTLFIDTSPVKAGPNTTTMTGSPDNAKTSQKRQLATSMDAIVSKKSRKRSGSRQRKPKAKGQPVGDVPPFAGGQAPAPQPKAPLPAWKSMPASRVSLVGCPATGAQVPRPPSPISRTAPSSEMQLRDLEKLLSKRSFNLSK